MGDTNQMNIHKKYHINIQQAGVDGGITTLIQRYGCARCPRQFGKKTEIRNHIKWHMLQDNEETNRMRFGALAANAYQVRICEFCGMHFSSNPTDKDSIELRTFVKGYLDALSMNKLSHSFITNNPTRRAMLDTLQNIYNTVKEKASSEAEEETQLRQAMRDRRAVATPRGNPSRGGCLLQFLYDEHLSLSHGDELDNDSSTAPPNYNCTQCHRSYYSWRKYNVHQQVHAQNDQFCSMTRPLIKGIKG